MQSFYDTYYSRPMVVYHDPFNSFFWWWMLDRSLNDRANWAYHHRYDMDDARYHELLAHDATLQARITQLEAQNVPRDPTYVPAELKDNPDLMYTDNYVSAAYNPQPTVVRVPSSYSGGSAGGDVPPHGPSAMGHVCSVIALIMLIASFAWLAVWLVFFKRWNI
jgi:hypothetical protein